jgi:hypothetical protein
MKGDTSIKQESQGLKEQLPNETTLKLETFTFTNATFYFSNEMSSAFDYGLMVSKKRVKATNSLGI